MENEGTACLIKRIIQVPYKAVRGYLWDYKYAYYTKKNLKKTDRKKIKVGFVVQMPELWDKQSSVYQVMCKKDEVEAWLIIVPKYNFEKNVIKDYGEEKQFFIDNCINNKYVLAKKENDWINIKKLSFDYLFFQRPYDNYLPDSLKSKNTIRFTRNCYIPYATPEIKNTTVYPVGFFSNLYLGFMEDEGAVATNTMRYNRNCKKGIKKFLNIGYPPFENCLKNKQQCQYSRFLWTPRWSYDHKVGGSHFMEYYAQLTDFNWGDAKLNVRPHPLMWDNFIKTGIITQSKVDSILNSWKGKGISVDSNKSIEDTFKDTDVLISDNSSVIPMFFLTGKPIIYCVFQCDYGSLFSTILPGLYVANNWEEVEKNIEMLKKHEDPLLSKRKELIDKHFSCNYSATENIVNTIINDFYYKNQ